MKAAWWGIRRRMSDERGFARNVALLAGGTAMAQVLTILSAPILTRLYTPADMGRLGLYMAFVGLVSVGASLRFETAIVSASNRKEAAQLVVICLIVMVPVSLIGAAGLFTLITHSILGYGSLPPFTALLVLPSQLLTASFMTFRYWMVREGAFGLLSRVQVTQSVTRSIGQVALWLFGWPGLILGDMVGRGSGMGRMVKGSWAIVRKLALPLDRTSAWNIFQKYRKFPLYSLPSSLIDTLAVNITLPLVSTLYGADSSGYFALVQRVLSLPAALLVTAVGDAFHNRMAEYARHNPQRAGAFFLRAAGGLLALGVLPAVTIMAGGPFLFGVLFGRPWVASGYMAAAMAPWYLVQLVVSPLSRVVFVFQGQETKLVYDMLSLLLTIGALVGSARLGLQLTEAAICLSIVNVVSYTVYFLLLYRIVRRHSLGDRAICAE